jgi:hypothetical protein
MHSSSSVQPVVYSNTASSLCEFSSGFKSQLLLYVAAAASMMPECMLKDYGFVLQYNARAQHTA